MTNLLALTNFQNGLFTLILGLVVIFAGMAVIVLSVSITGKILSKKSEPKETPVPVAEIKEEVKPVVEEGIPEHVKVAIIAAIAAYYGEQPQPKNEFIVRKIKKLNR